MCVCVLTSVSQILTAACYTWRLVILRAHDILTDELWSQNQKLGQFDLICWGYRLCRLHSCAASWDSTFIIIAMRASASSIEQLKAPQSRHSLMTMLRITTSTTTTTMILMFFSSSWKWVFWCRSRSCFWTE